MESKVQNAKKNADIAEENDGVTAEKIKFPLYVFPETMKTVDILYSRTTARLARSLWKRQSDFTAVTFYRTSPSLWIILLRSLQRLRRGL